MPTMIASTPRTIRIAGRHYAAGAGETIEAAPQDVDRLRPFGFDLVAEESSGDVAEESADRPLEELGVVELREIATDRTVEGRSSMSKAELVSALTPTSQEA